MHVICNVAKQKEKRSKLHGAYTEQ